MSWTAVIPFKGTAARKTRLSSLFSPDQRRDLSQRMFDHVCEVISACADIDDLAVLSNLPASGWRGSFIRDEGRGLNAELGAVALDRSGRRLLVIHADLPLLQSSDISALLEEAEKASFAIAPDRSATGTNALALLQPAGFAFHFGVNSLQHHLDASRGAARIVRRLGLSLDIDTPEDYVEACRVAPETMRHMRAKA
ncbi:2-phospho-L-lactate guanylyltransferase [Sphingobium sp. AN558]|uniref:2-phospho-L-lactate guanylyltransferase n=1 Tax=Sphingobium sp. AN558 TaxID=3133442 RepID=UPI0030C449D9